MKLYIISFSSISINQANMFMDDLPVLTLDIPAPTYKIIIFHPTTTQSAKTFLLQVTMDTELSFIKQEAVSFFSIEDNCCELILKSNKEQEMLITETNFDFLRQNYHIYKLLRVKQYSPMEFAFIQSTVDDLKSQTNGAESLTQEEQIFALKPIQHQQNSGDFCNFFADGFNEIRPILKDLGLLRQPINVSKIHQDLAEALLNSLNESMNNTVSSFFSAHNLKSFNCSF